MHFTRITGNVLKCDAEYFSIINLVYFSAQIRISYIITLILLICLNYKLNYIWNENLFLTSFSALNFFCWGGHFRWYFNAVLHGFRWNRFRVLVIILHYFPSAKYSGKQSGTHFMIDFIFFTDFRRDIAAFKFSPNRDNHVVIIL